MNLEELGWKPLGSTCDINIKSLARITEVRRGLCKAITLQGELNLYMSGKFQYESDSSGDHPAVGDFVTVSPPFIDEQGKSAAIIVEIIPRRTKFARVAAGSGGQDQVLAANIDIAYIVTSANNEFNINRLQRYVLLAKEGGVCPVIILSKTDLADNIKEWVSKIKTRLPDVDIIESSSVNGVGMEKIKQNLQVGVTAIFLGSSGVGKSTLVNLLLGQDIQPTQEIRENDSRGRHTTTSRELFFIPNGGMIIDTAGLRDVQVVAKSTAVSSVFESIEALTNNCRYTNCTHESEPGCAIQLAIQSGEVALDDYTNYLKLQKEAEFALRKRDKAEASNSKKRWKKVQRDYQVRKKFEN